MLQYYYYKGYAFINKGRIVRTAEYKAATGQIPRNTLAMPEPCKGSADAVDMGRIFSIAHQGNFKRDIAIFVITQT